jgi:hypothetical protein
MIEFATQARAIREEYVREDYTARIKTLVRQQLKDIDPLVGIEDTHYFNHSAIPDFIITWSGERLARDFFLRSSYASIVAADDISHSVAAPSVFLALDDRQQFNEELPRIGRQDIVREVERSSRVLITDVTAIDEIGLAGTDPASSPIATLVRENFVRGGRGWVDESRAMALVGASQRGEPDELSSVIRQNFDETAIVRLERTAALVDVAVAPGDANIQIERALALSRGSLSEAEMRTLLPWLLDNLPAARAERFWRLFAQMITFEDLQRASSALDQRDITALVLPNLDRWSARRAYLGLAVEHTDRGVWRFRGGLLGLELGDARVSFSSDGRSLKGRDGATSPRWQDLISPLASFRLASVSLRGVTRSVRIDAERSDDIRQDVLDVAESLSDSYSVMDVTIRFDDPTGEGSVDTEVEFGKSIVTATPNASIADLAHAALRLLSYRAPLSDEELTSLIRAQPGPVAES